MRATKRTSITIRTPTLKIKRVTVSAIPTCAPYFVITETRNAAGDSVGLWTITHAPTGYSAVNCLATVRQARAIAGALTGLPIDWRTLTVRKSRNIQVRFPEIVGKEIAAWIRDLERDDEVRFAAKVKSRKERG